MSQIPAPLQSDTPFTHPFAFATCHPEEQEVAQDIMKALAKNYKLMYYIPHLDKNSDSTAIDVLLSPFSSVVLAFLSPQYMTSPQTLLELMQSQLGKDTALPLVPVIIESIPYMNNQEYEDFLEKLPQEKYPLTSDEMTLLRDLLDKMYQRLQRDSNYAFYSQETMAEWDKFMKEVHLDFVPTLCYKICKEIINSLHCNFIFQPHYTEETLPYLYRDLGTRLRNSTGGTTNPFLDATVITAKEEKNYFNQYRVQGVKLDEYHPLQPEECVIQGGTLVQLNCTHEKVKLSFSVKEIGEFACEYNSNLREILLPNGIQNIGIGAFQNCTQLRRIYLPKDMEEIRAGAFEDCGNLEEINLPEGLRIIENRAFFNCINLKRLFMPDTVEEIKTSVFTHCVNLEEMRLPKPLKEVGDYAFDTCASLKSIIFSPALEKIGEGSFSYTGFSQLHLPNGLMTLGVSAFEGCYQLEELTLPETLTEVPSRAFADCSSLHTLSSPSTIPFSQDAFVDCPVQKNAK